ncbi:MAG TPA: hypothetical protein DD827_11575 [Gammaproteobacteria bacterium]|jgi:hypothetical protein|nr:hypothetical protein [Gammaproteobacteria bacterium]
MLQTVEAEIDKEGNIRLTEKISLKERHRALVIILEKEEVTETTLLSEAALAKDWNRAEEDDAWKAYQ